MVYFVEKPGYVSRHTFESPMHEWKDSKSTLLITVADAFAAMFTFHFLHFHHAKYVSYIHPL